MTNQIILRPKFFRVVLQGLSVVIFIPIISAAYLWVTGNQNPLEVLDVSLLIAMVIHFGGFVVNFKKHAANYSIALNQDGIEGPRSRAFANFERIQIRYTEIEKVTYVGRPRWLFAPKIVGTNGIKLAIDWGINDEDYRIILTTLENHYVKVSDYVWQIYPDR